VARFLNQCSARQVRLDPKKFRAVCNKFTDICRDTKQSIRAIKPLKQAIWKIGPGEQLTPQHQMCVLSCVLSKCYKAALPVLEKFCFEIDPDKTGIESVDTRLYFYYGGSAYIGLKQFEKAIEFLEIVISAPALVPSAIMVEAYKKYILVSLCHKGEVGQLPKYTNTSLVRLLKQLCSPYEEFSTSFSTRSVEDLNKVAANNDEVYRKDGNRGLVKQAVQALFRQNIQRLTKTYITLSLKDITDQVKLPNVEETERRVSRMIEKGEVFAKINQKDGMVEFYENPEEYNTNNTLEYLDKQLHGAISLSSKVKEIDEQIALSTKYIQKTLQAERGPGGGGPGGRFFGAGDDDDMGMMIDKPGFHGGPGGFRG